MLVDASKQTDAGKASAIVIDPGMGAAKIISQLVEEQQCEIAAVVLTHGHIDHIRDAAEFNVPVYIHPADKPMLSADWNATSFGQLFELDSMKTPTEIRELGEEIHMGGVMWTVHHMPGHSPGSVMFRAPGLILGGDVLFKGGVGRTDLPGSSPEDMFLSLKKLAHEFDDADVVLPGHGPQTTVGEEKRSNPFLHSVN